MGPSTPGKTSPRNGTRERSLTGRTRLDLDLLRAFELRKDGVAVSLPPGSQRLVAFLALRDRPLGRVHVAGNLWLDVSDDRACANLRTAVWRLRQLDPGVIESSATHMRLSRTVAVDVHDTLAQARRLVDPSVTCEESDLVGDALLAELLPDWYDDWVLLEQERFRQIRLHALESLCSRLLATRRFAMAIEAGLAAVAAEPLRESA